MNPYYRDKYYRLRARLGPRKAIVSIAHKVLKAIYAMIKNGDECRELREDYLHKRNAVNNVKILRRKAKELGFELVPVT